MLNINLKGQNEKGTRSCKPFEGTPFTAVVSPHVEIKESTVKSEVRLGVCFDSKYVMNLKVT